MYIWFLISKDERQVAGARAQAKNTKSSRHLLEKRAEHPPSRKAGEGAEREDAMRLDALPPPLLSGWHLRTLSQPQN